MDQIHRALLIAFGCLLSLSFAASAWGAACPEGWVLLTYADGNREECYRYYGRELNWEAAQSACEQADHGNGTGSLVSIRSVGENRAIYDLWASYQNETKKPGFWIGLQRQANEEGWQWTDGPQRQYMNWNDEQPTNATTDAKSKDCVEMAIVGSGRGPQMKWTTRRCEKLRSYMCNMPVLY